MSLLCLRDELLDGAAHKLRAEVDGDILFFLSRTVCSVILPFSGVLFTSPYTLWMCAHFSSAMGIPASWTRMAQDATFANAESIFHEIIMEFARAPLMLPLTWKMHRDHRVHMIHYTHQKAMKHHADWIADLIANEK